MASISEVLRDKLSQIVFKQLSIAEVSDVSEHFRRLRVQAPWLRGAACAAGDKLQIMINEVGPRTYSPFAHDAGSGTLELLAYVHGETATSKWIRNLRAGASCRVFGPRSSLALASLQGPIVFVGDETSFASAAALRQARGAADGVSFVFECTQGDEVTHVLQELGLSTRVLVPRQPAHGHLDALEQALRSALAQRPDARLVLTGHAQTIQALRKRLKGKPAPASGQLPQLTKAYWADGKRGLD